MRLIHKKVLQIAIVVYEKLNCKFYCPTFIILQILAFEFVFFTNFTIQIFIFCAFYHHVGNKTTFYFIFNFFLKQQ